MRRRAFFSSCRAASLGFCVLTSSPLSAEGVEPRADVTTDGAVQEVRANHDAPAGDTDASLPVVAEPAYVHGQRPVPEQAIAASAYDAELGTWNLGGGSGPSHTTNRTGYHAATRVIIDTRVLSGKGSLGTLSAGSILAQARSNGYWPYRLCFEDGLRAEGKERGKTVLRFSIDTRGKVSYARRMSTSLDKATADCLRKATYSLRFSPLPRRRVDVEASVQLSKGDAPLPSRPASGQLSKDDASLPSRSASDARAVASADLTAVQRWAEAQVFAVRSCFRDGASRDPKLWGRVALRIRRDAQGRVVSANEEESRFPDRLVVECIEQQLVGATLSEPAPSLDLVVAFRLGTPG